MADEIQQAIKLIEANKFDQARTLLLEQLKAEPKNDVAWFWMSKVVATDKLRKECLQESLKHNPHNVLAKAAWADLHAKPVALPGQWGPTKSATLSTKTRSVSAAPARRPNTLPFAILLFILALALAAATYLFAREDLTYRAEGSVMSATVIHLDKVSGSAGAPDQCQAEYQFMAYGAVRKNTVPVPCADWDQLSKTHRLQIQYLNSQPDRSRIYPPANPTDRYASLGFSLAALLVLIGIALIAWRFWPRNFKLALGR